MSNYLKSIAIIGGGPAGLMAAEMASLKGHKVTIYERMPSVARKFLMAGRGGLNLTHSMPMDKFIKNYGSASNWLAPLIDDFGPAALWNWCQELEQETFVGSSGRIFPKAMKASPLLRAWIGRLDAQGVEFKLRHQWQGWTEDGQLSFLHAGQEVTVEADATVLAMGGGSWAKLGSDGNWVDRLRETGVSVAPLVPSNVGLKVEWSELFKEKWQGHPIKNTRLSLGEHSARGEVMVTAEGIEGGATYALSPFVREELEKKGTAVVTLDLRADHAVGKIMERLNATKKSLSLTNKLKKAVGLPAIAASLLREIDIAGKSHEELAVLLKAFPITITGSEPIDRAISSAGGVKLHQLDETLMFKKMPGVYAVGEMLDWEAPTGGFLLQACFATGHRVGCAI
jgi:uncharacterized flavoprotein (TIGR03862 family)